MTIANTPKINADSVLPSGIFLIKPIIPNTAAKIPSTNEALFTIGIKEVHIPTIPNTIPAVARPLFFFSAFSTFVSS